MNRLGGPQHSQQPAQVAGAQIMPGDQVAAGSAGASHLVAGEVLALEEGASGACFIDTGVAERQADIADLRYRDRLLQAVTLGIGLLVKAGTLEAGLPEALRMVGESIRADRVLVIQQHTNASDKAMTPALNNLWQVDDIRVRMEAASFLCTADETIAVSEWHAPLLERLSVQTQRLSSPARLAALLERLDVQSSLIVPIFVGEALWGSLGIHHCRGSREWAAWEIDILATFGEIVGSAIVHVETLQALSLSEARFRVVTAAAQDAIMMIDEAGRIALWNPAAERILGYSASEVLGEQLCGTLAPEPYRTLGEDMLKLFSETGAGDLIGKTTPLSVVRKDGTEVSVELSLASTLIGDSWGAVGILRDITERKLVEDKLQFANILLKTQMEASLDGILIVDAKLKIIAFNSRFAEIWNLDVTDLIAGNDAVVMEKVAASVRDRAAFTARVGYLYDHPSEDSHDELETADERSIERYTVSLDSPDGCYLGRAWIFRDITERKQAAAAALKMARYDVLTGLANRAVFVEALERAIAEAKRGRRDFAVLYIDLDHFKDINDTLGHPAGDELLREVSARLLANTRKTDTVARFGGDEFAVVVADIDEPADAGALARKLIEALAVPFAVNGVEIHSGASIGIATYTADAPAPETLLSRADVALYRAKSEGRGNYRHFTQAMGADVQVRVELGADLRDAIQTGQLFLLYQPQIAMESGRIVGVEALVRWRHPTAGVLCPDLFIPIAEQIGVIAKLGRWVLRSACRQAKAWLDAGMPQVRVSVNVSALQLKTPMVLENDIVGVLAETSLPAHLLELELTESVFMDVTQVHGDMLQRLKRMGITMAIDDFGTGYSSFNYLRRFRSDRIKIARSLIENLETCSDDAAIVRATIGLAHELGIGVIAEGVETPEQACLLRKWGCGEAQGFLFGRPLPANETMALLRTGRIVEPAAQAMARSGSPTSSASNEVNASAGRGLLKR